MSRTPWLRNCFKQLPNVNKSGVREAHRGERIQSLSTNLGAAVAWPDAGSILGGTGHDAYGRGRPNAHAALQRLDQKQRIETKR